jgi:hypothetical protein
VERPLEERRADLERVGGGSASPRTADLDEARAGRSLEASASAASSRSGDKPASGSRATGW